MMLSTLFLLLLSLFEAQSFLLKGSFPFCDGVKCHNINEIFIFDEVLICTNDLLARFEVEGKKKLAYLTNEKNLINKSFKSTCYDNEILFLKENNYE